MSFIGYDPAKSTVESFRQGMSKLQSPNRYSASFEYTGLSGLSRIKTYPDGIQLPQRSIQTMEYSPWGFPTEIPVHGTTSRLMMSFIILSDWSICNYFEAWMNIIQKKSVYSEKSRAISSYDDAVGSCSIEFHGNQNPAAVTKRYSSIELYPIDIPPMEFSSMSTGYASFDVLFYVRNMFPDYDESTHMNLKIIQQQKLATG